MKKLENKMTMPAKILLVDDDDIFRSEFIDCFQEYGIAQAGSAEEALAKLKRPNEIDLVILDVRMSGMNGIEALSRIRKVAPSLRIIISTAYSSKDVAVEALRGQADDYIEKPLDIEATRATIENMLSIKRGRLDQDADGIKGKIERVKEFLERNCFKKVTLKDAAELVCLSPKYLSRIFEERTGTGFSEYKLSLKTEQAKLLLTKTAYNINQISEKLGYENAESFIRYFKKSTKRTPTEFRRKKKKK